MRHLVGLLLAVLAAFALVVPAAAPAQNLVVQVATEPPGLDLTATPASATAAVAFYNLHEALVKVERFGTIVTWLDARLPTTDNQHLSFVLNYGAPMHY